MSQDQARRLSARRGSVSAADPLGKHASLNHDPNRSSSSRLTIVRVLESIPAPTTTHMFEPPPSPILHQRRSLRRPSTSPTGDHRLSFAFSSFAPASNTHISSNPQGSTPRTGSSPSSSPRLRPSSPSQSTRRLSSSSPALSKPNLSPDQLLDLARQSTSPRFIQHSPGPSSTPIVVFPIPPPTPGATGTPVATFTPLPPDVYLPFIDRPAEVTILLSTPPTTKLFSLLAHTFQMQTVDDEVQDQFPADPSIWTFHTLRRWLTSVDRPVANDTLWVRNARRCILAHSELIWERIKGALGVPPELELEDVAIADVDKSDTPTVAMEDVASAIGTEPCATHAAAFQTVIIEPIIATPSSNFTPTTAAMANPPPLSLPSALIQTASISQVEQGLQNIVEGEEEDVFDVDCGAPEDPNPQQRQSQIHGIRVSTSPVPSSPSISPHVCRHALTSSASSAESEGDSAGSRALEQYFHSLAPGLSDTKSQGSVPSIGRPTSGSYTYRPGSPGFGDSRSECACESIGDRVPGSPLFPSNFACLTVGPALRVKH